MNLLKMLKPMVNKMLPKIRESILQEPLNTNAGEFQHVILIDLDSGSNIDDEVPLSFFIATLSKIDSDNLHLIQDENSNKIIHPVITKIRTLNKL
jgi:hypothetical protein